MENLQIEQKKTKTVVLKPSSNNKDVIQSYILTTARYDFSVYEKRILYRIIECFQYQLEGKKLDKDFSISKNLDGDINIELPISSLLPNDEEDKHHDRVKKAVEALESKRFVYEDSKVWRIIRLIERPEINKYDRHVRFRLHYQVYQALLNFSKGYRKFELEITMKFRSVYAMRFYELLSGQTNPLTYSIETLRAMFQLENKHKPIRNFVRYVIEPAKRELDKKSPYSFTYELQYEKERNQRGRKKVIGLIFTPIYHSEHRDKLLVHKGARKEFNLSKVLFDEEIQILLSLGFTEQELQNNYSILEQYSSSRKNGYPVRSILEIVKYVKAYPDSFRDLKAYMIGALRTEVNKHRSVFAQNQSLPDHGTVSVSSVALPLVDKISCPKNPDMGDSSQEKKEFDKKKAESLRSFLKDYLPTENIEKGISYFVEHGTDSLNRIVLLCEGKNDKIRECIQILIK